MCNLERWDILQSWQKLNNSREFEKKINIKMNVSILPITIDYLKEKEVYVTLDNYSKNPNFYQTPFFLIRKIYNVFFFLFLFLFHPLQGNSKICELKMIVGKVYWKKKKSYWNCDSHLLCQNYRVYLSHMNCFTRGIAVTLINKMF